LNVLRPRPQPTERVNELVGHLFRHKSGEIVATLVRLFGIDRLELVEDVVQEALLTGLKNWSFKGIPDNPAGWIVTAARNRALDIIRRDKLLAAREKEIVSQLYVSEYDNISEPGGQSICDDQLALIFACCTPELSHDSQVALVLKLLAGLSVTEIAKAFLTSESVIAQRLVRAKRVLRCRSAAIKIPEDKELEHRLKSVHQILYLMFNEGYNAHAGDDLVRHDLVGEALRLTNILVNHHLGDTPGSFALMALMCLQASRIPARVDQEGNLVLLSRQDRSLWDKKLICDGMHFLDRAAQGDTLSAFHLEAGIAGCHATAPDYSATDWKQIVFYYDALLERQRSPVLALNRAIALSMSGSIERALAELEQLADDPKLAGYYLYHASRAELFTRAGQHADARRAYLTALKLTESAPEQRFLRAQIAALEH
jgi:RNA polymerase sigma-70 factor (ECF subfamily)